MLLEDFPHEMWYELDSATARLVNTRTHLCLHAELPEVVKGLRVRDLKSGAKAGLRISHENIIEFGDAEETRDGESS
ncbi:unnamed protein product [Pleuronectes platessa]|uniref:Uncharacterized protein n=1 Tax=Pleuronectes platessa TaxID=8262 RepID=A0A9N7TX93_PLEPL|nr:unnamed protein product [Pleuronectes platessa]